MAGDECAGAGGGVNRIELPSPDGNVISIESARTHSRAARQLEKLCLHTSVIADPSLVHLHCKDCDKDINPIDWILMLSGEWDRVRNLYEKYRAAVANYEAKKRCRCEHCHKITNVRPATTAEVREFNRCKQST